MEQEGSLWSGLPAPAVLAVFCLAESSADAIAWKCACKSFYAVCGKVDMLRLRVLGDASPAVAALETSRSEFSTWFGLDLDVAPMELVQQGRLTSPFVLRAPEAKLVEQVMKHLHAGIRWARLSEPASFSLPYHLAKLSHVVTLELVLNPAMEEVVFHSAAFQQLHSLRRLTLQGRLPPGRRRGHRRALPHLAPSVTHLAAHGLNLGATEWAHFGHLRSLDLSESDVRLGPYCGALLCGLSELRLRDAQLELATPSLFADMSGLRRLDLEGCTALRAGSWLSRVLTAGGAGSDVIPLPAGLQELRAMRSNVFDKCALELGAATGLRLVELSSGAQLPASLKHAAGGAVLGVHIAEEAHAVSRHGRDAVVLKACLAERLGAIRRLSAAGLGRGALNCVAQMAQLRRLCLLAGERRRMELGLELPELEVLRIEGYQIIELRLPVCLKLHTAVLAGHGVCGELALPPSLSSLVLLNVMRDARSLRLADMLPRLKTAVLGMGWLTTSLPHTVERLAVVGEPSAEALAQACSGLERLLPQLPHLRELRLTSGEAGLPVAVAAVLPRDCQFSTAGMPREGPAVDAWGRSLHQTAPLAMDWADSLLTAAGVYMPAVEADEQEAALHLSRQVSRVLVS
ncbi:hypothetical protein ABPG77_004034 [Micractinium sp. CCAP 211/92]